MIRSFAEELEFDKVLELVAAHARTGVGRAAVRALDEPVGRGPSPEHAAELTRAVGEVVADGEALALAGIDDAVPLLEDDAPPPSEPHELLSLLTLARRAAAVHRRLAVSAEALAPVAERIPDTRDLIDQIAPLLGRDGRVADDATPELRRARREIARARSQALEVIEGIRRAHHGAVTTRRRRSVETATACPCTRPRARRCRVSCSTSPRAERPRSSSRSNSSSSTTA